MYTDPFDFITTRSNPVPMLEDASDSIRLLPYVPADFNFSPSIAQGTSKAKDLSLHALIASDLAKIPNNAPAYQYTTQQEKRYDNPYLQYTPSNILGTDTEDIYGRIQGAPSQLANSLLKAGANFGGTFFSNFLSAPKTFDLVRGEEIFEENDKFSTIQNWLMAMEDKLPNYYTEVERNRSEWINAIPFSGGAMNFWGDKVVKNIGFSMGALTSGLVIDAGITAAATALTGGAGTPAAILNGLNRLRKTTPALFTSMRNLAKSSDKIDDITAIARQTGNFSKGLEVSALSRIPTVAKYATVSYLTAQGEAFIEGYHTWLDTKRELLEDAIYRGETDEATMADIDERAKHAGRWTTGLNMPIIMASNLFQFPNLLMGRNVLGRSVNDFVKTQVSNIGEEGLTKGLKAMSTFSTKRALRKEGWEAVKDIAWEGAEEGAQYHIGSSVHDYYSNRLNPYLKSDLLGFVLKNIPETLSDDQFWKEAGIGGLTGFLMGSPSAVNRLRKGREQADQTVQSLNNVYDRFNSAVKQYSSTIDLNNSNSNETIAAHDTLYASVHDSLKFGTYDSFLASLRDLKEMTLDEYNKGFGQEFKDVIERDQFVDSLIQDSENMKSDVEKVNSFYQTNPYTTNPIISRIKKALNPQNEEELNNIQENLFNDYKEVVARNESLLRKTNGLILNLKGNLKALGMKDESLEYVANLAQSPKGFKDYLKFKESQIKDLQRQVTYYEELAKNVTDTSPTLNPKEQLKEAKNNLDSALKYYEKVYDKLGQLEKDPKNKEVQDSIREDVVYEESTQEQRDRYTLEKRKREVEALEQAENLKKTTEAEVEKPEKLAEQILEANAKAKEESVPLPVTRPVTPNIDPLADFEIGKDVEIQRQKFTVESLGLDKKAVVKDANGIKYKTDGKSLEPINTDGIIAQTELPFEDSQSRVINKIKNPNTQEGYSIKIKRFTTIRIKNELFYIRETEIVQNEGNFTYTEISIFTLKGEKVANITLIPNQEKTAYKIDMIVVSDKYQGRGISTILYKESIKVAKADGYNKGLVSSNERLLESEKTNYSRKNFKIESTVWNKEDAVFYTDTIDEYNSSLLSGLIEQPDPVEKTFTTQETLNKRIDELKKERDKTVWLANSKFRNVAINSDGFLEENLKLARKNILTGEVEAGSYDFRGDYYDGIPKGYAYLIKSLEDDPDIDSRVRDAQPTFYTQDVKKAFDRGLINNKVDAFAWAEYPEIMQKYQDKIDKVLQTVTPAVVGVKPTEQEKQNDPVEEYTSSKTEFETYVDTGKVSDATVSRIAQKIKSNQPLTKEEIAMYSDAKERIESKLQESQAVTRGTQTFTIDQIQNYPNTYWIRSESAFDDPSKVFEIQDGGFFTRKLVGIQDGVRISERTKEGLLTFDKLRQEVNEGNTFVQVLSKNESEIPVAETVIKDVSSDIKKFLGNKNTSLYKTIEDQITKRKIKLEC
jgi:predicted GNAT family acetyltransferase